MINTSLPASAIAKRELELAMLQRAAPQLLSGVVIINPALVQGLDGYLRYLEGRNCTASTLRAYASDLAQFVSWLFTSFSADITPEDVGRADIEDYLFSLSR